MKKEPNEVARLPNAFRNAFHNINSLARTHARTHAPPTSKKKFFPPLQKKNARIVMRFSFLKFFNYTSEESKQSG